MTMRRVRAGLGVLLGVGMSAGALSCSHEQPPLSSRDPARRIPAMKAAAAERDRESIPLLIESLDSGDAAVRFYAIRALRELTGQTLGYEFYGEPEGRREAVERWKEYWRQEGRGRREAGVAGT